VTVLADRLAAYEARIIAAVLDPAPRGEPEHAEVTTALVRVVLRLVLGRDQEGGALRDTGRRFAECGVSHAVALHELHRVIIEMSRQWWAAVAASDVTAMLAISQSIDDTVDRMRAELSDGYCAALAASGTRSLGRRQLAESLLTGRPAGPVLLRAADVEPAGHYLVLSVPASARTEVLDDPARSMSTPGALARRAGDRIDVLVPVGRSALDAPGDAATRAFRRLAAATGATVAGAAVGPRARLVALGEEARTALEVGAACGRVGVVLPGQVLVERAMTGSASAVQELAGLVASLARWPHLPATLAALYEHDLDRSRTAEHLHIARRTLTKRLDRIHQLTGVHPTSAHGVQIFLTALSADRIVTQAGTAPSQAG
jgi:hypothetical protein